ncbi:MAG: hypothetical protein GY928_12345 [Colwellia sp.]|nr:hypothetical protein [Colwellia sp.]
MPIEPRFRFLLKRVQETTKTQFGIAVTYWRFNKILKKVKRELAAEGVHPTP